MFQKCFWSSLIKLLKVVFPNMIYMSHKKKKPKYLFVRAFKNLFDCLDTIPQLIYQLLWEIDDRVSVENGDIKNKIFIFNSKILASKLNSWMHLSECFTKLLSYNIMHINILQSYPKVILMAIFHYNFHIQSAIMEYKILRLQQFQYNIETAIEKQKSVLDSITRKQYQKLVLFQDSNTIKLVGKLQDYAQMNLLLTLKTYKNRECKKIRVYLIMKRGRYPFIHKMIYEYIRISYGIISAFLQTIQSCLKIYVKLNLTKCFIKPLFMSDLTKFINKTNVSLQQINEAFKQIKYYDNQYFRASKINKKLLHFQLYQLIYYGKKCFQITYIVLRIPYSL